MIDVRCDLSGLRIAADAIFEEMFLAKELEDILRGMTPLTLEGAPRVQEAISNLTPKRTVAKGYFEWAYYLMWLRHRSELAGVGLQLRSDEMEGILVVRAAENAFRASHPTCYKCGAFNLKDAGCCRECSTEFPR